jgi:hypothetical protein
MKNLEVIREKSKKSELTRYLYKFDDKTFIISETDIYADRVRTFADLILKLIPKIEEIKLSPQSIKISSKLQTFFIDMPEFFQESAKEEAEFLVNSIQYINNQIDSFKDPVKDSWTINLDNLLGESKNLEDTQPQVKSPILKAFQSALDKMKARKWDTIYIAIDLHDTICTGKYLNNQPYNFLGKSKETLQFFSKAKWIKLILFTSSYEEQINSCLIWLEKNDIHFDYVNENPECENTTTGNFNNKFYYNVLLDDKAGFYPEKDWEDILNFLKEQKLMNKRDETEDLYKLANAFIENLQFNEDMGYVGLFYKRPFGDSWIESDILEIIECEPENEGHYSKEQTDYAWDLYSTKLVPFLKKTILLKKHNV